MERRTSFVVVVVFMFLMWLLIDTTDEILHRLLFPSWLGLIVVSTVAMVVAGAPQTRDIAPGDASHIKHHAHTNRDRGYSTTEYQFRVGMAELPSFDLGERFITASYQSNPRYRANRLMPCCSNDDRHRLVETKPTSRICFITSPWFHLGQGQMLGLSDCKMGASLV